MTIEWPDHIPLGIKYGAETEIGRGNKISTEMDYGGKRSRKRFTNVPSYQTIEFKLKDGQVDQFIMFYRDVLQDGTVSFNAKVISGSDIITRRCKIDDDSLKVVEADYNYHTISFTLEIYDLPVYVDGYGYILGLYTPEFVLSFYDYLEYVVNTQYPTTMEDY